MDANHSTDRIKTVTGPTLHAALRAACIEVGLVEKDIPADGRWHRTSVNGDPRGRGDGSVKLFADGGGGVACNFKGEIICFFVDDGRKLNAAERRDRELKRFETIRRAKEEQAKEHAVAEAKAVRLWNAASPADGSHRYLIKKGVGSHGLRVRNGVLIVPVRIDDRLSSVQFISPSGNKRFLAGGAVSGGYFIIGELNGASTACLCEGYATGASIYESTGLPTVVAFDASNLLPVAQSLRARFPDSRLVLCTDDDVAVDGNPGLRKASEAARAVGGLLAVPDFGENRPEGMKDFNDLVGACGAEAVREAIAGAEAPTENGVAGNEQERLQRVEARVWSDDGKTSRLRPQADILIDIGRRVAQELFLGNDDRTYAVVRDRSEVWPVASGRFRAWLRSCYFTLVGKGANSNAIKDSCDTIEASARDSGVERRVFLRVAEYGGKLYVDLCDRDWRVVEVDAEGWRILERSPVMFTRRGGATSFPIPERGGSLDELWPLVNVPEDARPLVGVWSVAALYPRGPYPPLAFQGEHGSAKSSMAKIARFLCDPSDNYLRSVPKDEDGFKALCAGAWCICIDNLSGVQPWLSDLLCRAASGITLGSRKLYTDLDEELIKVCRPIILNGIDPIAVRGDLADRTITLTLNPISDETRLTEEDLYERFEKMRPRLFGVLLSALSQVVRDLPNTQKPPLPRMASFAMLGIACETALGFKAGDFMRAYKANIAASAEAVLDSAVAAALIEFIRARVEWSGTASELLKTIGPADGDRSRSASEWPKNGRGMSAALTRFAPALRRIGIHIEHTREAHKGTRLLHLACRVPAGPSPPSPSSPTPAGMRVPGGDGSEGRDDPTVTTVTRPSPEKFNEFNNGDGGDDGDGPAGTVHMPGSSTTPDIEEGSL